MEENLQLSQFTIDRSSESMFWVGPDAKFVRVNDSACRFLGYTREELLSLSVPDIDPNFPIEIWPMKWEELKKRGSITVESVHRSKEGREHPVEITANYLKFNGQEYNFCFARDITERKQAEEKLLASEGRLREILEGMMDVVVVLDLEGRLLRFNKAFKTMFGWGEEAIGKSPREFVVERDIPKVEWAVRKCVEVGFVENFECTILTKDKKEIPVLTNITLIRDPVKDSPDLVAVVKDITEVKRVQRMKDEFISTVSHELRTPLTSIHGSLSLVNQGKLGEPSERIRNVLDIAERNSIRLKLLINDLLDIQKIESGAMDFTFKPINLAELTRQALEANLTYALQYNVRFVLEDVQPDVMVYADDNRLRQVMDNFLSNAAKFSPPDSNVGISTFRHGGGGGGTVRFAVKDNGPGIPAEFHGRIFNKFTQVDSSNTRQRGGTGLGLYIAKSIVEEHGGKIGFETELNKGTTFYFELPEWQEE